jgi:hypothetical protein
VVVTGYFNATADFGGGAKVSTGGVDIFLAKYSSAGTHTWSKVFGTSYGFGTSHVELRWMPPGNIALTGSLLGPVNFGGGALAETGSYDIFAAKFSASGAHLWSKRFGVLYDDHGNAIVMDAGGNIIMAGDFSKSRFRRRRTAKPGKCRRLPGENLGLSVVVHRNCACQKRFLKPVGPGQEEWDDDAALLGWVGSLSGYSPTISTPAELLLHLPNLHLFCYSGCPRAALKRWGNEIAEREHAPVVR